MSGWQWAAMLCAIGGCLCICLAVGLCRAAAWADEQKASKPSSMTDFKHLMQRLIVEDAGCFHCTHHFRKQGRNPTEYGCDLGRDGCEKLRLAAAIVRKIIAEHAREQEKARKP